MLISALTTRTGRGKESSMGLNYTTPPTIEKEGKLCSDIKAKSTEYNSAGNRIWKNSSEDGTRRYIVDIVGKLPVILMELNSSDASNINGTQ